LLVGPETKRIVNEPHNKFSLTFSSLLVASRSIIKILGLRKWKASGAAQKMLLFRERGSEKFSKFTHYHAGSLIERGKKAH
jgi:hypothetical protein